MAAWRAVLAVLAACLGCAAQSEPPQKGDSAAEVLAGLPAISAPSKESTPFELFLKEQTVGWALYEIEAKPDAAGGAYSLHYRYIIAASETEATCVDYTAEVDPHFSPRSVRFAVRLKKGDERKEQTSTLEIAADGCTQTREETGAEPQKRKIDPLGAQAVTGIEFLLPRLPREKIEGITLRQVNAQAGEVRALHIHVGAPKDGRVSVWYTDAQRATRSRCIFGADGRLEAVEQPPLRLGTCTAERLAELQKKYPDLR